MKRDPLVFIEHILESIGNIVSFSKGVSKKRFLKNKEKQSAIIRQIEIVGEAVKNLPSEVTVTYSDVDWRSLARVRDKLIHHYFGVDLDTVWEILQKDLPDLKKKILKIKKDLEKEDPSK